MVGVVTGLDLATIKSGYCYGDGLTTPTAGAWTFPHVGEDLGWLACELEDVLTAHIERERPVLVNYESPILVSGRDRPIVLRKLYGMGMEVERICRRKGIECREAGLRKIKKELAGFSGAGKTDMVFAAERIGVQLPATLAAGREDAADATGAWLLAMRDHDKTISAQWDRRLYAARGALI